MPFKSRQQMRACFATKGFNGKVNCEEWAKVTDTKSLPERKEEGGYNMLRPKNCKKCGGKMQQGGISSIEQANALAKRLGSKLGLINAENLNVGDQIPRFYDSQGRDVTGLPAAPNYLPSSFVPNGINQLEWDTQANLPYYIDPQSGDMKYTTRENFGLPRFQPNRGMPSPLPSNMSLAVKKRGGNSLYQRGGLMYDQIQRDLMQQISVPNYYDPAQASLDFDIQNPITPAPTQPIDRIQEGISKGIIDPPNTQWYEYASRVGTPRQGNNIYQTLQNIGIGLQGASTGLSFLAGARERGRQNQYDMNQQSALGLLNPMQVSDYQPNPYSLYAKYGGNLKTIIKDYNKYTNNAQMDFGSGDNDKGKMKKGGYELDRMLVVRKVLPDLLQLGRMKKRMYEQGGEVKKGGIHIKPENKGKFTDYCGGKVTDECIQKGLDSPSATIRKRANFARNARKWN